ncbi:copper resistance CopC family protein [Streptomyces shenzhenensis]|uniref:copper resistance CopC family protein n=1 Tax=Streptomyces shenzhenensis TaxID=943815 RepID=UPI003D9198AB
MHVLQRRAARSAARVLVVPAALAALTVAAPQAAAHTELDTAGPAADAALASLPPRITLTFSDPMDGKCAKVAVTGPDGTSAADGSPEVDGRTVTLGLKSGAAAGRYTVGYRVVSADGHPVSGSYAFTLQKAVGSSSPPAEEPVAGTASPTPVADRANDGSGGPGGPALAGGAALVAAGVAASVFAVRRRKARHGD